MANELRYIIRLLHDDKGIAYTAKTALQNASKQPTNSIRSAQFLGQPTGKKSEHVVTIDDSGIKEIIQKTLENSGRMPKTGDIKWSIESIEREGDDSEKLRYELEGLTKKLRIVEGESASLRGKLNEERADIHSPLEGVLAYFDTLRCSAEPVMSDAVDISFAQRFLNEEVDNSLADYVSHNLGRIVTVEEIKGAMTYSGDKDEEMEELEISHAEAIVQLAYLDKLRKGITDVPESLRKDTIRLIEAKRPDEIVEKYEAKQMELEERDQFKTTIRRLQGNHDRIRESLEALSEASQRVPVVFNSSEEGLEIFFPFRTRLVSSGLVGDLSQDISQRVENGNVLPLDSRFVAYRLEGDYDYSSVIESIVEDVPLSLRLTGYDSIDAIRIGA